MGFNGKIRLGDVCTKIGSGATPRGGKKAYRGGRFTLVRSQNIYNHGFEADGLVNINDEQAANLSNAELEPNDVLLNITGDSVARCCQIDRTVLPARVNQHVAIIRPDPQRLDPGFLRYKLVSPEVQHLLLANASAGGTRNALTKGFLADLAFEMPPLSEQRAIASILGSLDDKIELNRRMNRTLEEMARALFKSWFVDFDPVHANAAANPTLPPDLAALFPSEFEPSPIGDVPKGWAVRNLDEIASYLNGLALQKYPPEIGEPTLPVLKIAQLRKANTDGADRCNTTLPDKYIVRDGDVIFSWSGSLLVRIWANGDAALNQHLFKVTSNDFPRWFYYLWTLRHLDSFQQTAASKATTMGHIKRHHLSDAQVLVPPPELVQAMTRIIEPLHEQSINCDLESRTLADLRDSLLPRLLSGALPVADAEEVD